MSGKYILDKNKNPILCDNLLTWGQWMETADRHVSKTTISVDPEIWVSTVFLGLDHGFDHDSKTPILWETMVFGGKMDEEQERYATRAEAVAGHLELVDKVRAVL